MANYIYIYIYIKKKKKYIYIYIYIIYIYIYILYIFFFFFSVICKARSETHLAVLEAWAIIKYCPSLCKSKS